MSYECPSWHCTLHSKSSPISIVGNYTSHKISQHLNTVPFVSRTWKIDVGECFPGAQMVAFIPKDGQGYKSHCVYMYLIQHITLHMFICYIYLYRIFTHVQFNISGFFLVFFLSVFVTNISGSEKHGSHYRQFIYVFTQCSQCLKSFSATSTQVPTLHLLSPRPNNPAWPPNFLSLPC